MPGRTPFTHLAGMTLTPFANLILLAVFGDAASDSTKWLLLMVFGGMVIMATLRPGLRRKREDPLDRPASSATLAQHRAAERDVNHLLVQITETARQMTAQLDTRAAKLELLLREADEKIASLQSSLAQAPSAANGEVEPGGEARSGQGSAEPWSLDDVRAARVKTESAAPLLAAPSPIPVDPGHTVVYALADQGRSISQIASELSRPSGEVELILALRGSTRS